MHADMPAARKSLEALSRTDSLNADVWGWLAFASGLDLTLRRDAAGREYLPADFTKAIRSYAKAIELDGSDHRNYLNLASMLSWAMSRQEQALPGYREPPSGTLQSLHFRVPARWYSLVLKGDSLIAVPSESLSQLYSRRVLDSLRTGARDRSASVVRRWLTVAPDEGEAWLLLASLDLEDKAYDKALRSLAKAESLGTISPVPMPLQRLGVLLTARRYSGAIPLGDSLAPPGGRGVSLASPLYGSLIANYEMTRGRVAEATALIRARMAELQRFEQSDQIRRQLALSDAAIDLRVAGRAGTVTRALLNETGVRLAANDRRGAGGSARLTAPACRPPDARGLGGPGRHRHGAHLARGQWVPTACSPSRRRRWPPPGIASARRACSSGPRGIPLPMRTTSLPWASPRRPSGGPSMRSATTTSSIRCTSSRAARPARTGCCLCARSRGAAGSPRNLGTTALARKSYDEFLTLWSDPDAPAAARSAMRWRGGGPNSTSRGGSRTR